MLEILNGKKIGIVGLGTNNKKLTEFFSKQGLAYEVIEWENAEELIGKLDSFNIIFRTPGLPYLSKAVQQAKNNGVEISSQTKLFFELCPAPIIGITGTKGKGTTSSLIAKILEAAGRRIWLGGNIGLDPFEFLDQIRPDDIVILELSSFQLQDMDKSPHIAVVLNVTSDHLNHHQSADEYRAAKTNILLHQNEKDYAVLHPKLPKEFISAGLGNKIIFNPSDSEKYQTKLLGSHNQENISAALAVAKILKIDDKIIRNAIAEFEPLPHRLKLLRQVNDITYIDDAFSTNIDPTIAAIEAIKTPIVLILGGSDKQLDFSPLGKKIKEGKNIKGLVVLGDVTEKILQAVEGFDGKILTGAKNMQEILGQAQSLALQGDTILFSPATASFGLFENEFDRAAQFVNAVLKL